MYVPDLADLKKQKLRPEGAESVKTVFQSIGRNSGIACFSYGCGPALVAAMNPEINDKVRFVVAFGGYFDIREALEFLVTGPESPIAYGKWIYLAANADLAADENDQRRIRKIAEDRAAGRSVDPAIESELSIAARPLVQLFSATDPADFRAKIQSAPESLRRRLDALSPSHYMQELRAPLILVHGAYDPSIPAQQSIELAEAARIHGIGRSLTLLRMYGHTNPTLPKLTPASIFAFYIPEGFRFVSVVNRVLGTR